MIRSLSMVSACIGMCWGAGAFYETVIMETWNPVNSYMRPDSMADLCFQMPAGVDHEILVRTADGWLGFDPGVAQAGNSGSFRYRWVPPGGEYTITSGDPDLLEIVWGPSAGYAYAMTFEPVQVYLEPDSNSEVVDSMPCYSAAVVTCRIPGWYRIDPVDGPHPGTAPGWISEAAVSFNGAIEDVPLWFND